MNFEVTGKLLEKYDSQQVSDRFKKREFVLELSEEINGSIYTNFAKMQLVQAKCELLDRFKVGDEVKVNFSIRGNKWERDGKVNYITNLDAWRVEAAVPGSSVSNQNAPQQGGYNNNSGNGFNSNGGNNNYNTAPPAFNNSSAGAESADDLPF